MLKRILPLLASGLFLGACAHPARVVNLTPVPDQSSRIGLKVDDTPEFDRTVVRAASCLVRTGVASPTCDDPPTGFCDRRSEAAVSSELSPALSRIRQLNLTLAPRFNTMVRNTIGMKAMPTLNVADARLRGPCTNWPTGDARVAKCGAFQYGEVWVLVSRSTNDDGPPDYLEIFLASGPCRRDVQ